MKAPTTTSNYTLAPEGSFVARCYQLIHIGTIEETYMGESKVQNKIRLTFELPTETKVFKEENGEQPIVISQDYTFSMGKKANLRRLVEGLTGRGMTDDEATDFDIESIVGEACILTIKHRTSVAGKERAEIASASPLVKGMKAPKQVNPSKVLSYENFDEQFFATLPSFLKEKMQSSDEYQKTHYVADSDLAETTKALRDREETARSATITSNDIPF